MHRTRKYIFMFKDRVLLVPVQCCLLFMNLVCMIQRSLKTSTVLIALSLTCKFNLFMHGQGNLFLFSLFINEFPYQVCQPRITNLYRLVTYIAYSLLFSALLSETFKTTPTRVWWSMMNFNFFLYAQIWNNVSTYVTFVFVISLLSFHRID